MTYLLTRRYKISAAHHLFGLGETHKCARPHGHNYTIDLTLSTQSLNNGMVLEMGALDVLVERIVERLDHVDLNAFDDGSPHGQAMAVQPTAENIAGYLWITLGGALKAANHSVSTIRVQECDELWVEVTA